MDRCPKCGWHHTDECMGENMAADHNPAIPRTRTPVLISAMRLLARDIESEDGVANAAMLSTSGSSSDPSSPARSAGLSPWSEMGLRNTSSARTAEHLPPWVAGSSAPLNSDPLFN